MRALPRRRARVAPTRLRPALIVALALLSCLVALAVARPASAGQTADGGPTASASAARFGPAVLAELNRIRTRHKLPRVTADRRMSRYAAAHSRDMARRGYFAHGAWSSRVARASGSAHALGEVLGWLGRSGPRREARGIVRGWLDSPPHRAVLLDASFRRVGIGRAGGQLNGISAAIYTVDWASAR
ncbi:CAP domain-containing protein [Conexibacter sp. CPCC 206217]|uniref:CAP domain-containing protein n=1 Tax=Conexibacter sp. CPCC 206217 TaxID=3064574 RepID=UPI0027209D0A|nr:CAP domain-containing protein [Conexibacter sp. CPCC 206217]MDO8211579.1 CAP domain-containing protein [Conexibacter sp. CPCC 206217]